jgi:hypothetical protein
MSSKCRRRGDPGFTLGLLPRRFRRLSEKGNKAFDEMKNVLAGTPS